jgi:DNA-binding response OmpR family regulator
MIRARPDTHDYWLDGKPILVTWTEGEIMARLCQYAGYTTPLDVLLEIWGESRAQYGYHIVSNAIGRLKAKLPAGAIECRKGIGYRLTLPVEMVG